MEELSEIKIHNSIFTDMQAPDFKPVENTSSAIRIFRTVESEKPIAKKGKIIYIFDKKTKKLCVQK